MGAFLPVSGTGDTYEAPASARTTISFFLISMNLLKQISSKFPNTSVACLCLCEAQIWRMPFTCHQHKCQLYCKQRHRMVWCIIFCAREIFEEDVYVKKLTEFISWVISGLSDCVSTRFAFLSDKWEFISERVWKSCSNIELSKQNTWFMQMLLQLKLN